ncbi:unnamed protein product [Closterium sp. Yama58-4]|nr:unnamed protein product [Closterium sp. Yama58-4]
MVTSFTSLPYCTTSHFPSQRHGHLIHLPPLLHHKPLPVPATWSPHSPPSLTAPLATSRPSDMVTSFTSLPYCTTSHFPSQRHATSRPSDMVTSFTSLPYCTTSHFPSQRHGHLIHLPPLLHHKPLPVPATWSPHSPPSLTAPQATSRPSDMVTSFTSLPYCTTSHFPSQRHGHLIHLPPLLHHKPLPVPATWSPHSPPSLTAPLATSRPSDMVTSFTSLPYCTTSHFPSQRHGHLIHLPPLLHH